MNKDIVHVILSDMHTGSNQALFVDRQWQGLNTSHIPRNIQVKIREHFLVYCEQVAQYRKGKKVRLVINGDLIEGFHHSQQDICTMNLLEQADLNIEIVSDFQKHIKWQAGDELYITKGTEVHSGDWEDYIGRELNAQMDGTYYAHNLLVLDTNGSISWFVHHGPAAGAGANEGNTMRNWLRNIYYDALKDNSMMPDIVYTGHVHTPTYSSFIHRDQMNFYTMHGIILPSWQAKTRYAHMRVPVAKNKIGGVIQGIKADGTIEVPQFIIMET